MRLHFPTSLRSRFLAHLRDRLGGERWRFRVVFWDGASFDFAPDPQVTIALHSKRLLRFFSTGNIGRLGKLT